ncbi:MAG TPA: ParA family protein [Verrucomicrobiae bacterium]|nr:ParA family protein [Verrucomicrobiae bacterium]
MSSHPVSQIAGQVTRFLFGSVRYTQRDPSVVIAVLNLKGGCGKSTIAVNLACELASGTDSVLLVDNDSQGTASHWLSHGRLPVRGEYMPLETDEDGERLVRAVAGRNERYVVLDAPAHVGAAAFAAGKIADLVLVPVTASGVDLVATRTVVDLIRRAREVRRSGTPKCLIVPSKIDRRTDAGRRIDEQVREFGESVGPAVHQRTAFVDAFGAGQWIGEFAPLSPAHYDITALAMAVKRSLRI